MKTFTVELWRTRRVYQEATVAITEAELTERLGEDLSVYSENDLKGAAYDIAGDKAEWRTEESEIMDGWVRTMTQNAETSNA